MPWYKVEANTGAGHQSKYLGYVWQDNKLTRGEKEDLFKHELRDRHDAVGTVVAVRRLPAKIRVQKIRLYLRRIEAAKKMLVILTPNLKN